MKSEPFKVFARMHKVYGKLPMALFKVMTANQDVIHILNEETGSFEEVERLTVLQAPSVNGVFDISQNQMNFEATLRKRFSSQC